MPVSRQPRRSRRRWITLFTMGNECRTEPSVAGLLYRLGRHRGWLQDRHRLPLQTVGPVLGQARRRKHPGFALPPRQPPPGSILAGAPQCPCCRQRLSQPGGVTEEIRRAPSSGRTPCENCARRVFRRVRRFLAKCIFLNGYGPINMVGAVRFELTTSCTPSKRATKLRYAPTSLWGRMAP